MSSAGRFAKRARYYARYRPDYPAAALDAVFDGLPGRPVVADIGAGTGISSRQLAARAARVFAVEPNEAMAGAADPAPCVEWVRGTAEETRLADRSCDLVFCAQAYHWFDRTLALREFHRILRPGGRLALIWNIRDFSDEFQKGYERVLAGLKKPVPWDRRYIDGIELDPRLFAGARRLEFPHEQRLTRDELVGRTMSLSYFPLAGPDHDRRMAELDALLAGRGSVTFRYLASLWLADSTTRRA